MMKFIIVILNLLIHIRMLIYIICVNIQFHLWKKTKKKSNKISNFPLSTLINPALQAFLPRGSEKINKFNFFINNFSFNELRELLKD